MCGYFCPVCLADESCNSFTRRPELDIIISLHSSTLTTRDMVCIHSNSPWCRSHWTVNAPTKNLNDLIYTRLTFSVSFLKIYFFLNFQLLQPLHTTSVHTSLFLFIFQKMKKQCYGGCWYYAITLSLLFPGLLFIQFLWYLFFSSRNKSAD